MTGFIYVLKNKINGKRYVGKTTQTVTRRIHQHFSDAFNCQYKSYNGAFQNSIRKYGASAFELEHVFEFVNITDDELNEQEMSYIQQFNSHVRDNGYNMTYGGDGGSSGRGLDVYDSNMQHIAHFNRFQDAWRTLDINPNSLNAFLTKQNKIKTKILIYGNWFIFYDDQDPREYGDPLTNCKMIDMYDLQGNFINTFTSLIEIAEHLAVTPNSVSACCRGKTLQCQGYVCRYYGDEFNKFNRINVRRCSINLLNENKEIICTFPSMLKLAEHFNVSPGLVRTKLLSESLFLNQYYIVKA